MIAYLASNVTLPFITWHKAIIVVLQEIKNALRKQSIFVSTKGRDYLFVNCEHVKKTVRGTVFSAIRLSPWLSLPLFERGKAKSHLANNLKIKQKLHTR